MAVPGGGVEDMKILLVCLGNICRSPMAEGVFRQLAEQRGLDWQIDSAGTADYHVGEAPDRRAQRASAEVGIAIENLRGRQVEKADFTRFDWILALDRANLRALQSLAPAGHSARLGLLLDPFLEGREPAEVADPYWGEMEDFRTCRVQIQQAAERFFERTGQSQKNPG